MPKVDVVAGQLVVVMTRSGRSTHLADHEHEGLTVCGDAWTRMRMGQRQDPTCRWCQGASDWGRSGD